MTDDAIAKLLRQRPYTAREICAVAKCSKPTAYAVIARLRARGLPVYELTATGPAHPGPRAIAWGITRA